MNDGARTWLHDVAAGDWIAPRLHPFFQDTGSVVPTGFDAYCRIFHPIGDSGRWTDLAQSNGRIAHAEMQLHLIATPPGRDPGPDLPVSWGSLPLRPREELVDALRSQTTTPDRSWFAVWEGFGQLDRGDVVERIELPNRKYLLRPGPIEDALAPLPSAPR